MTRRCSRCGDPAELLVIGETRCPRCIDEVNRIIAADELRRTPRFAVAKELGTRPAPL